MIKRSDCRPKHAELAQRHGRVTKNEALGAFRTGHAFALKVCDDAESLPDNPVGAVSFLKEAPGQKIIMPEELPACECPRAAPSTY